MAIAGTVSFVPKGEYNAQTTYKRLNTVRYQNKVYVSLKTVVGVTPSDDKVNWMLFVDTTEIAPSDIAPEFSVAATRENIMTGESLPTLFGKIKKYFTDLKGHAFNDPVNNLTTSTTGSALDASQGNVLQGEVDEINSNLGVIGKCKNLLNPTLQTTTLNGVTCTNNGDGTYTLNGTCTNTFEFSFNPVLKLPYGKYKLLGTDAFQKTNNGEWIATINSGDVFEVSESKPVLDVMVYINSGSVVNETIKPMVTTNLNATVDDFVPYTGDGKTLASDVANVKNDLDKLNALPIGTIIQIEADKDTIATTEAKYSWQYLGTSNIQYENGGAYILATNVYRKNN